MVIHVYLPHKHKWKGITSTVTYLVTNYSVWDYRIFCKNCYITSWFNFRSKMFRIFTWLISMQMCTFDTLMECSIRWRHFLKYWFLLLALQICTLVFTILLFQVLQVYIQCVSDRFLLLQVFFTIYFRSKYF